MVHGRRRLIAAGIAAIALAGVLIAVLGSGGGSPSPQEKGFRIGRLHPGTSTGAGVGAEGLNQLQGANMHPLRSYVTTEQADQELDLLKAAGGDVVRIDLGWESLEQTGKGQYLQWYVDKVDTFLHDAKERGIAVIAVLWLTPCWASTAPDTLKQDCSGTWWKRGVDRYPPADPNDYADIAAYVAQRWGSELRAIEVWNEPNLPDHSALQATDPAAADAALLKAAYPPIKDAAPDVDVLAGGLFGSDANFLNQLYDDGIHGYFDGLAFHPYTGAHDPNDPNISPPVLDYVTGPPLMESTLATHGDGDKGLWLTELGWPSCLPGGTDSWCVTQDQQAQYVGDALRIAATWPFVKATVIYNFRNTGTSATDRESQFGLVNNDFTLKPAYAAFHDAVSGPTPAQTETGTTTAPTGTTTVPAETGKTSVPANVASPSVTLAAAPPPPFTASVPSPIPAASAHASAVTVKIRCKPIAAKRCRGSVRLSSRSGTLLARGTFALRRGLGSVRAKLTKAGRVTLNAGRPPAVVVTVTTRGLRVLRITVR